MELRSNADTAVHAAIGRLLAGDATLPAFQEWFVQVAWKLGSQRRRLSPLSRVVELRLAEYTAGHWTVSELLDQLADAAGYGEPLGSGHAIGHQWREQSVAKSPSGELTSA